MSNSRDYFFNTRVSTALASSVITTNAVQTGVAIDVSNAIAIAVILNVSAWTSGSIGIQDVQFADDSAFTTNLVTYTSDDVLLKNDRSSLVSAITQSILSAIGRRKVSLENRAINNQKWMRVRTVSAGGASLTADVIVQTSECISPVVQA